MRETEIKHIIKEVVRQCITEVAPPGEKAERMVMHLKKSLRDTHPEWDDEKVTSVAIATAWKAHNRGAVEEAGLTSEEGCQCEKCNCDPCKCNENGDEGEEHEYDEKEEIRLMKGLSMIVKKLLSMHKGMDEQEVNEGDAQYKVVSPNATDTAAEDKARQMQYDPLVSEKKEKWIQKAVDPKHKGYCTPMTKKTCTPRRKALAKRFKKGLEEMLQMADFMISESNGGPQYKVVSPNATDTAKEDKAREIQRDPKVSESSNHKVQHRSHTTINDVPQNPENVRDPEVPMTESSFPACHHRKMKLKDDGHYECENCGKVMIKGKKEKKKK